MASEFHKGKSIIHKSRRDFSATAIGQTHEQNNAVMKGDVGAIGLTVDSAACYVCTLIVNEVNESTRPFSM